MDDVTGYDFVDRPGITEPGDYATRDPDPVADRLSALSGHGAIVAGAMSAAYRNGEGIAGVAPGARLVPLRAFAGDGRGATADIAAAILYAADNGIDVVNLSLGATTPRPSSKRPSAMPLRRGPSSWPRAATTAATRRTTRATTPRSWAWPGSTRRAGRLAGRAEYGTGIDLGAPGSFIYTTRKPSADALDAADAGTPLEVTDLYGRASGSSMAAPQVAGAVALLRSDDPSLSPASIRTILTGSAVDIEEPGWDHRTAAGRLDVAAALGRSLPGRTAITAPRHLGGLPGAQTPIVGSAIDPSFVAYEVFYAEGHEDLDDRPADPWVAIRDAPARVQALDDTLAVWSTGALAEGPYTLRLVTTVRDGGTIEDRRRVYIDRTAPTITIQTLGDGLVGGALGVVGDVRTDDLTTLAMDVTLGGRTETVDSEVRHPRHGIAWPDAGGRGGRATVRLRATNASGLVTTRDTVLDVPPSRIQPTLFRDEPTGVPYGFQLPQATDFDGDGLRELVFNQYDRRGLVGDTLAFYEWTPAGFRPAAALLANLFPRDTGDTNANGRTELLTQLGGAALVVEQDQPGGYPFQEVFFDTLGLRQPSGRGATWGARLTDLDRDGRGELLVHTQKTWRVLEYDGAGYAEVVRVGDPSDPFVDARGRLTGSYDSLATAFQQPLALVGDFDGDGRTDVVTGTGGGNFIVYEATGNDALEAVWTFATPRFNAGARFAKGDFDGDGLPEFVTYTEGFGPLNEEGEREPPLGLYYFWDQDGDDAYRLVRTLPVQGNNSKYGDLRAADFDGDGTDEVVLGHPPDVYLLDFTPAGGWQVVYHRAAPPALGLRTDAFTVADFDGDGAPEVVFGVADQTHRRLVYQRGVAGAPPPQWVEARAEDASGLRLVWRAAGADSVTVFAGPPGQALDPVATTPRDTLVVSAATTQAVALRAWRGGTASPLSAERVVRPHAPATVADLAYPQPTALRLRFTEPLAATTRAGQFRLASGPVPEALSLSEGGRAATLRFARRLAPGPDSLYWRAGVTDAEGLPVGQTATALDVPSFATGTLIVSAWTILDERTVALTFSEPLDRAAAETLANYAVEPVGRVAEVRYDATTPAVVTVRLDGAVIGATGGDTALRVAAMTAQSGNTLVDDGVAVRLVEAASDLADVYVYPNPYRLSRHGDYLTIAGLPLKATIRILSPDGALVRVLEEEGDGNGGRRWDLRDRRGQKVPSGIYLIRVESPGESAVLKKAAVIR